MFPFRTATRFRLTAGCLAGLLGMMTVAAGANPAEARASLLTKSPFVPYAPPAPVVAPVVTAPQAGPLSREIQFNGILAIGDKTLFSIFDKTLNQGLLLGLNEPGARFTVVGYEGAGDRMIQVKAGNRIEQIPLQTSDGIPMATVTPAPVNNRATQVPNVVQPSGSAERRAPVVPRRRIIPARRSDGE